jgi:TatD DNase family protein
VQRRVFSEQLALATAMGKPIVVHAREADADIAAILREQPAAAMILHSFSSGPLLRDAALEAGWYLSFSGMITFKWWTDLDALRLVAPDRMLVETDAPYLAPVPHRGKRNEPGFVVEVARHLARIRGQSEAEAAALTTANAERLFW